MADEISMTGTITYTKADGRTVSLRVPERFADTTKAAMIEQTIGTSEEALDLGDAASPTALFVVNLDADNFVNLKVGTGGAIFAKLEPDTDEDGNGGFAFLSCLGSGAQAPFAIADTAACTVLIFVAE